MKDKENILHFVAGLPRAGSTFLLSVLAQNPRIHSAPVSGLAGIFSGVYMNWDKIEFHRESKNDAAKRSILKAVLDNYHESAGKPVIIDKDRQWMGKIRILEEVLGRKVKMIMPVRPVIEILTSFEVLRLKDPLNFTVADEQLGERSTVETRCEYFANPSGPLGVAYNCLKDAVMSGFLDRMMFVDYNKFVRDPKREIGRIYDFLGEPKFEHDLSKVKQLTVNDDSVWRLPGLHDIRPSIGKVSQDPLKVLGPDLCARYDKIEPWEQWT